MYCFVIRRLHIFIALCFHTKLIKNKIQHQYDLQHAWIPLINLFQTGSYAQFLDQHYYYDSLVSFLLCDISQNVVHNHHMNMLQYHQGVCYMFFCVFSWNVIHQHEGAEAYDQRSSSQVHTFSVSFDIQLMFALSFCFLGLHTSSFLSSLFPFI